MIPFGIGQHPGRGAFFVARVSEGRSPDDPGYTTPPHLPTTPPGVGRNSELPEGPTPYRGRIYL